MDIYADISKRTNGEIYLGVVGPVRTGKSTFIKRFMDLCVLPNMDDEYARERALDELPQSAGGTTVMTTEPKFVPSEGATIYLHNLQQDNHQNYKCISNMDVDNTDSGISMKVRLVDCVGFMVDGANGHMENGTERLVHTPWSREPLPFSKAAAIGTSKVIEEHSTIGIVVTTDGSFSDIDRASFIPAEEQAVSELKHISKPFVIVLNCLKPYSQECRTEARKLSAKYDVEVIPMNCDQLRMEDITILFGSLLKEFPVTQIVYDIPNWTRLLPHEHWLRTELIDIAWNCLNSIDTVRDADGYTYDASNEHIDTVCMKHIDTANGIANVDISIESKVYYNVISELTGTMIRDDYELIDTIRELSIRKNEYTSVATALEQARTRGFGVVTPPRDEIELDEPMVIHNGSRYGVRLKAKVPSINLLKTDIDIEIAPIVGTKAQADDLISYIKDNTSKNSQGIWDTNIFGKTIEQIVSDGIYEKTHNITQESMDKIGDTLRKVINENTGLVCIIV